MGRKVVGMEKAVVVHEYWYENDRKLGQECNERACRRKIKCQ